MDSITINFDQLAEETLQLSEQFEQDNREFQQLQGQARFNFLTESLALPAAEFAAKNTGEMAEIPAAPGLFYWPDLGKNTFILRAAPSTNLKETMEHLFAENCDFLDALRIKSTDDENLNLLNFYQTETFEMAEVVRDQLANRRFLYHEEQVCNISDPGHSWWANISAESIKIHFRSYGLKNEDTLIKLGPIGDQKIAQIRFDQASQMLPSFFPVTEYSCSDKGVIIATAAAGHPHFEIYKEIFVKGEFLGQLKSFPKGENSLTLYFYFKELAVIRKFWLQLEKSFSQSHSDKSLVVEELT